MSKFSVWQKTATAAFILVLIALYATAWWPGPATRSHADAEMLLAAQSLAHGHGFPADAHFPPLFPVVLALLGFLSQDAHWLKLIPVIFTAAWCWALTALLRRIGASTWAAFLIAATTLAAPAVVDAGTTLSADPLFALLVASALVALLDGRMELAGLLAGLSAGTRMPGVALIAASMAILVCGRRLKDAIRFAVSSMLVGAPMVGWTLSHSSGHYSTWSILSGLQVSEKASVLGHNAYWVALAPFELLSGVSSENAAVISSIILIWSWFRRRQLMPDLVLFLYVSAVLSWSWPPQRSLIVVLPLILWIPYRAFRNMRSKEAFAAFVVLGIGLPVGCSLHRIPTMLLPDPAEPLYAWIRQNTPSGALVMANLDANMTARTGRAAVRGIDPNGYDLWYAPRPETAVNPALLLRAVRIQVPDYVAITPNDDLPESKPWQRAVEALERGGVLEAVPVPGLSKNCRLLRPVGR